MPRIKRTLTKSERKMVDDLFKAACKDHNNPTTTANNGANDDSKCKREDSSAADDALSANQPDEKVSANATEKEVPTSSNEEDANPLAPQQHTATGTIANPPVTHDEPSNSNDRAHKRKSSSGISDNEMESAHKKNRVTKSFEQRIKDLRVYKEKNGHVNVKEREDKSLNEFCRNIRRSLKNPGNSRITLYDDRIASLDALGFDWTAREYAAKKSFAQRIEDLLGYKERHGHMNVKKREDASLYEFCNNIRKARKNPGKSRTALTDDRIASLDALGFNWTVRTSEQSFAQRIDDLQAYKEKHGHVNVKKSDDESLNRFCYEMRRARNNPEKSTAALTDDRIASLVALGFDWSIQARPVYWPGRDTRSGCKEII